MPRICHALCLALLLAGCKDWTRVPPPPVAFSALDGASSTTDADFSVTPAASRVRLLRALSPGALVTLHFPDMGGTQQRFRGTTLHGFLNSPEMKNMLRGAGIDVDQLARLQATGGAFDAKRIENALRGDLVLSLVDLEWKPDALVPTFKAFLGVSVAGAEHEVQQLLDFATMAMGNNPQIQVEQGSLEGTAYTRFRVKEPVPLVVEAALYRDALLVGVGRDVVTEAVRRLEDETIGALPDEASFGRCMQRVGGAHDIFRLHVDLAGLYARVRDRIPDEAKPALDLLGFEHMKAVAGSVSIRGKDLVSKGFLDSPGGKDFITDLLRRHAADRSLLRHVPGGATSFSLFTIDGQVILDRLRAKLKDADRQALEDGLKELAADGWDLENDLLRAFGPRFALVTLRAGRRDASGVDALWNHLMGTAFLVEIRDAAKAHELLGKLPKGSASMLRRDDRIGTTPVVSYEFPRERLPRGFAIVVAPVGGYLAVSLSRETMEQMLQPPSDETAAHFRKMIRDVPETAVALSYDDLSQSSSFLMIAFTEGMRRAAQQTGREAPEAPALPSLNAHGANPSVSYTLADEHGVFTTTRSPTGGLTEIGGLTGVLAAAAVVMPSLAAERVRNNETDAVRTLEEIRGALAEYRAALVRDADADGEGEYAYLSELLADEHARDGAAGARALLSGFERTELGYKRDGYYYRVYLPGEDGSPIGEHESLARRKQADGDLSESIVVLVAWPVRAGITGRRSFLLDGRNSIYFCDGGYGGDEPPSPDLLSTQEGNLAAEPLAKHERARDGRRWLELR